MELFFSERPILKANTFMRVKQIIMMQLAMTAQGTLFVSVAMVTKETAHTLYWVKISIMYRLLQFFKLFFCHFRFLSSFTNASYQKASFFTS